MKNFSNRRKSPHKKPRNIMLLVTRNERYKETEEYIALATEIKNYIINPVLLSEDKTFNEIKLLIDNIKREMGIDFRKGDKIIYLNDFIKKDGEVVHLNELKKH